MTGDILTYTKSSNLSKIKHYKIVRILMCHHIIFMTTIKMLFWRVPNRRLNHHLKRVWKSSLSVSGMQWIKKRKDLLLKSIKQNFQPNTNWPTLRLINDLHKWDSHHWESSNNKRQTISQYWTIFHNVKLNSFSQRRCKI